MVLRRKGSLRLALIIMGAGWCHIAQAQALPAASRAPIEVGAAFSFASPDYNQTYVKGISAYGGFGLTRRLYAVGEFNDDNLLTPGKLGETTALAGIRYSVSLQDRANIYAKVLGGVGWIDFKSPAFPPHTDTSGVFAFGGGINFRLSGRWSVRCIDLEEQLWPGYPPHGLNPVVVSMGITYMR